MFKFMIGARRRPGITRAQFSVHYQQIHGGKVLADPERYVERYVQNHVRDGANGQQADGSQLADLDAVSEIWFEDASAMQRGASIPITTRRLCSPTSKCSPIQDGSSSLPARKSMKLWRSRETACSN